MKLRSAIAALGLLVAGFSVPAFAADAAAPKAEVTCCKKADCCDDCCTEEASCCKDNCCADAKNCCADGCC